MRSNSTSLSIKWFMILYPKSSYVKTISETGQFRCQLHQLTKSNLDHNKTKQKIKRVSTTSSSLLSFYFSFANMKFAAAAALAIFVSAAVPSVVQAHSTEIRHCILADGNLRIYVEHWHGLQIPNQHSDTMNIRADHLPGQPVTTLSPTGWVHEIKDKFTDLPGCEYTVADTQSECEGMGDYEHWVYYDFPAELGVKVSYTIMNGNGAMLMEGCSDLLPASIAGVLKVPTAADIAKAKKASGNGDPHFSTWSGDSFDCEYLSLSRLSLSLSSCKNLLTP